MLRIALCGPLTSAFSLVFLGLAYLELGDTRDSEQVIHAGDGYLKLLH